MPKYEYAFDVLELNLSFLTGWQTEGHQEIIQARAKNGWVYDGWIPTKQFKDSITEIQLIFHREIPENT